ncbi:unnamed protein product [Boreogadus saida]
MTRARMRHKKQTEKLICPCSKQTGHTLSPSPNVPLNQLSSSAHSPNWSTLESAWSPPPVRFQPPEGRARSEALGLPGLNLLAVHDGKS